MHKTSPEIERWFNFLTYNNAVAKKVTTEAKTTTPKIIINQGKQVYINI